jgi:hypothetical protein
MGSLKHFALDSSADYPGQFGMVEPVEGGRSIVDLCGITSPSIAGVTGLVILPLRYTELDHWLSKFSGERVAIDK